jgi:hypothetical protein
VDVKLEPARERERCVCVRRRGGRQTVWKRERGVMRGSNAYEVVERKRWKGVEAGVMKSACPAVTAPPFVLNDRHLRCGIYLKCCPPCMSGHDDSDENSTWICTRTSA